MPAPSGAGRAVNERSRFPFGDVPKHLGLLCGAECTTLRSHRLTHHHCRRTAAHLQCAHLQCLHPMELPTAMEAWKDDVPEVVLDCLRSRAASDPQLLQPTTKKPMSDLSIRSRLPSARDPYLPRASHMPEGFFWRCAAMQQSRCLQPCMSGLNNGRCILHGLVPHTRSRSLCHSDRQCDCNHLPCVRA